MTESCKNPACQLCASFYVQPVRPFIDAAGQVRPTATEMLALMRQESDDES